MIGELGTGWGPCFLLTQRVQSMVNQENPVSLSTSGPGVQPRLGRDRWRPHHQTQHHKPGYDKSSRSHRISRENHDKVITLHDWGVEGWERQLS